MKKTILTTLITGALAASVFAQGDVSFKGGTAIAFKFSTDGITALTPTKDTASPVDAVAGSFGVITVDVFAAAPGTSLAGDTTASSLVAALTGAGTPWALASGTPSAAGYLGSGVYNTATVTLNNITPGNNAELEVIAFTGTLANPTLFGFSGETFNSAQEGALGFVNSTGGVGTPPSLAAALVTGSGGFDGITLETVPEPTTMALGGLGAAALLLFRRRK
jgi:hypothetical protein